VNEGTTTARENQRCWSSKGRQLFFVDPATGELLEQMNDTIFNAPVTGGVSFFPGGVGTIATRAFMTDADGVIWRIDMSSMSMAEWSAQPFHDLFYDGQATSGQPAYFPPVLTTDIEGNVVVIQGTGDIDLLDSTASNKVASITELISFQSDGSINGPDGVRGRLNWEIPLQAGEQVTGPLDLFDGNVYFATFRANPSPSDACAYGESYIWGVEYLQADTEKLPLPAIESVIGSGALARNVGPFENQVIMGVTVTQRPQCDSGFTESFVDPYSGQQRTQRRVNNQTGGQFELVAQVSGGSSRVAGSQIGEINRAVVAPTAYSRVQGHSTVD